MLRASTTSDKPLGHLWQCNVDNTGKWVADPNIKSVVGTKAGAPETYRDLYDEEAAVVTREFADSLPLTVVVPAFVLAELKLAFQMGVMIFIPFLVIDLVVSAILVAMGMFMLPPILVSLPFKILVFVLADGWSLVVEQLLFTGSRVVA